MVKICALSGSQVTYFFGEGTAIPREREADPKVVTFEGLDELLLSKLRKESYWRNETSSAMIQLLVMVYEPGPFPQDI